MRGAPGKRPRAGEGCNSEQVAKRSRKWRVAAFQDLGHVFARFNTFFQDIVTRGAASEQEAVVAALQLTQEAESCVPRPKYFQADTRMDLVSRVKDIDAIANGAEAPGGASGSAEDVARELYGNLFFLCNALKPRQGQPATGEHPNFEAERVQRFFDGLSKEVRQTAINSSLSALGGLADAVVREGSSELGFSPAKLRAVLLMLAHPGLMDPSGFSVLKKVSRLVAQLHALPAARECLVHWYATLPLPTLERLVGQVQQFITIMHLEARGGQGAKADGRDPRDTRDALRVLDVLWRANEQRRKLKDDWRTLRKAQEMRHRGELFENEASRCLPRTQFYNDAINGIESILKHDLIEALEKQQDGLRLEAVEDSERCDFGILEFPFVLRPLCKVRMLYIESQLLQRIEARSTLVRSLLNPGQAEVSPYLVLKVRRSAVLEDALAQLATCDARSFRKPLKVVFDGEEGEDEGGVQKEFFQLLIQELYNEDFGMFERLEGGHNFWFNKNSFEAELQFELFGVVLGLAIYNKVIIDVKFPRVAYKKLIGGCDTSLGLSDLLGFDPQLAQGLIALLEHDDSSSFQDVFGPLQFVVEYDCFGSKAQAELKEGGRNIDVTFENREEYVQRYCEWIFNEAVERQYEAFRKGFDLCMRDTLFRRLFQEDELETVICGSTELDFHALEKRAKCRDGFESNSPTIRWFWEVVHSLPHDEKRSLLQFATGCDRAPVGGLGNLPLIISRAGPDSDRLPSTHTCFNHLMLPAYSTKEKLERRLRLAIQHCTGFGLR